MGGAVSSAFGQGAEAAAEFLDSGNAAAVGARATTGLDTLLGTVDSVNGATNDSSDLAPEEDPES